MSYKQFCSRRLIGNRQSTIGNAQKSGMLCLGSESNEEIDQQMWDSGGLDMGDDDCLRARDTALLQQPVEIANVVVAEDTDLRSAHARRREYAGMTVRIENQFVAFADQAADDSQIGHESGAEDDCVPSAV